MLLSIPARNNGQKPRFTWYEMDTLRAGEDTIEQNEFIAVTEGAPGSTIRAAYHFARPRKSVQRLIDGGYLTFVRHEIYPRGASCDVYKLSPSGKAAVEAFYSECHEESHERDEAYNAKRKADERWAWRIASRAELERQFGVNLYLPSIFGEICESTTPFINAPLPTIAPNGRDGQPISIREYMLTLWTALLSEEGQKKLGDLLIWGQAIGFQDAADMLLENGGFSAYDLFGLNDDTESDE